MFSNISAYYLFIVIMFFFNINTECTDRVTETAFSYLTIKNSLSFNLILMRIRHLVWPKL